MLTYQVRVFTTSLGEAGTPQFEHLVDIVATDPTDAIMGALQMAAARADLGPSDCTNLMPLSAEIVTDSSLTDF